MLRILEPLLIKLPSIALCMAIEEQNDQQKKGSLAFHLPDKEMFKSCLTHFISFNFLEEMKPLLVITRYRLGRAHCWLH